MWTATLMWTTLSRPCTRSADTLCVHASLALALSPSLCVCVCSGRHSPFPFSFYLLLPVFFLCPLFVFSHVPLASPQVDREYKARMREFQACVEDQSLTFFDNLMSGVLLPEDLASMRLQDLVEPKEKASLERERQELRDRVILQPGQLTVVVENKKKPELAEGDVMLAGHAPT